MQMLDFGSNLTLAYLELGARIQSVRRGFWNDFGRILKEFRYDSGRMLVGFRKEFEFFGPILEGFWKDFGCWRSLHFFSANTRGPSPTSPMQILDFGA